MGLNRNLGNIPEVIKESGGKIGIGTDTPLSLLNIQGSGYFPAKLITLNGAEPTRYSGNIGLNIVNGSTLAMSFGTRSNNTNYDNTLNIINGNIGIGTTNPSYPLKIEKSDEYSLSYKRLIGTCKEWAFGTDNTTTYFRNMTDGTTAYTITNSGSFGINDSNPSSKLTIVGPSLGNIIKWTDNINNTGFLGIRNLGVSIGSDDDLIFETGGTSKMRIYKSGNLYIGTSGSDSVKLKIEDSGVNSIMSLGTTNTTGRTTIDLLTNGYDWEIGARGSNNTPNNSFYIYNIDTTSYRFIIQPSGNVLIGSQSDAGYKLDVTGTTILRGNTRIDGPSTILQLHSTTGTPQNWWVGQDTAGNGDGIFYIYNQTSGTQALNINKSNKVYIRSHLGIGWSNPSANLQVLGNCLIGENTNGTAYIGAFGGASYFGNGDHLHALWIYNNGNYAFTGSNVSDIRAKENINDLDFNATEKVMNLKPKSYYMKHNLEKIRYGFIAQDVDEVLPDLVNGNAEGEDYIGLDYNGIIPVLTKAIQEQQEIIKQLTNRIINLENK